MLCKKIQKNWLCWLFLSIQVESGRLKSSLGGVRFRQEEQARTWLRRFETYSTRRLRPKNASQRHRASETERWRPVRRPHPTDLPAAIQHCPRRSDHLRNRSVRNVAFYDKKPTSVLFQFQGWGTTSFGGSSSDVLLEVLLPVWKQTECGSALGRPITEKQLCAGYKAGGKDSCQVSHSFQNHVFYHKLICLGITISFYFDFFQLRSKFFLSGLTFSLQIYLIRII